MACGAPGGLGGRHRSEAGLAQRDEGLGATREGLTLTRRELAVVHRLRIAGRTRLLGAPELPEILRRSLPPPRIIGVQKYLHFLHANPSREARPIRSTGLGIGPQAGSLPPPPSRELRPLRGV